MEQDGITKKLDINLSQQSRVALSGIGGGGRTRIDIFSIITKSTDAQEEVANLD